MKDLKNKSGEACHVPPYIQKKTHLTILPDNMENTQLPSTTHARDKELTDFENEELSIS